MVGVFACPECGRELAVEGLTPGRQVQCGGCSTWVEVPYLPRAAGWKRGRRRSRGRPRWWKSRILRSAIVFLAAAMVMLAVAQMYGKQARSDRERVLAELVASANEAEAAGRFDAAFREIEAAVSQARAIDPKGSWRLDDLSRRRDRASRREAEARLAALDTLDPDRAVGEALTLAERARLDPALAPLAVEISSRVAAARRCQAEAGLAAARRALDLGLASEAFDVADRLHTRARKLDAADSGRFLDASREIIETAIARHGVAIPMVEGRLIDGSADIYNATLDRLWGEVLRLRGYLPQPRRSAWRSTWDEKAPFRATAQIVESRGGLYLQSKNRTTEIEGTLTLLVATRSAWEGRVVARTRSPLPDLPAYHAGHLATAGHRDPVSERQLHDDARTVFFDLVARTMRGVPEREKVARTR